MIQKFFKSFGTLNTITIFDSDTNNAANEAASTLQNASARWSVFNPDSEISQINNMAGKDFVLLNTDTFNLLKQSVKFSKITDGAFDITVQPLIEAYNFADKKLSARQYVNYKDLLFDDALSAAMLKHAGQKISLGAIAKGYAADICIKLLKSYGIHDALINFGGTVAVLGTERQIGIRHPLYKDEIMCTIPVKNAIMSTSGGYERSINTNGKTFCHIFDTNTCKPSETDLLSVTILSQNGAFADAISTAVFAMGIDTGSKLCKKLNVKAILADDKLNIYATENLKDDLNVYAQTTNNAAPA